MNSSQIIARGRARREQGGYAILLVLFLATLMLLATMAVAPNLITQGRREREKEMIWRGQQYARGIKMYYRKTGKFPTSLEDLSKPKIGLIRFMRQAYKDPMNLQDGEWRLIYVGPAGQLLGSLKPQRALSMSGFGGGASVAAPNLTGPPGGSTLSQQFGQTSPAGSSGFGSSFGQPFGQSSTSSASAPGTPSSAAPPSLTGDFSANSGQSGAVNSADADAAAQALLNSDSPNILGGNIIGVGSKVNHSSIIVFDTAKNYKLFEFIWDPSKDAITLGGTVGSPAGTIPGASTPGTSGFGPNGVAGPAGTPSSNPPPFSPNPVNPAPLPPDNAPAPPPQ